MGACAAISSVFPKVLTCFLFFYTGIITISYVRVVPTSIVALMISTNLTLSLYSYFKVASVGAGTPMEFPELRITNIEDAEEGLELPPRFLTQRCVTLKRNGRFRFCRTCVVWKPDRCHHCSGCNKCYLKMDHHCPWFASCVGYRNQKYFIHFLLYTTAYSILVFFLTGADLLMWFRSQGYNQELINLPLLIVWILSLVITISMLAFTSYTIYLVAKNQTTIEMYEWTNYRNQRNIMDEVRGLDTFEDKNVFDLGSPLLNWKYVMGESWWEWLFPVQTYAQIKSRHTLDESGLYFKINKDLEEQVSQSMDLQERLLRRLTPRSSFDRNRFGVVE